MREYSFFFIMKNIFNHSNFTEEKKREEEKETRRVNSKSLERWSARDLPKKKGRN